MSITTYAELTTAVSNWLHRSDTNLTDRVAEFVTLGEARIGREVKARQMEQRVSSTPTTAYTSLPSDYVSMRAVRVKGANIGFLTYVTPDSFFESFASSSTSTEKKYTIFGDELIFPSTPDGDVELWYYKKLAALSSSVNTLFTDNPDLYLYAALATAQPFMKDKNAPWEALFVQTRESLNMAHKEGRYPGALTMQVA